MIMTSAVMCLALNVYYEARNQDDIKAQAAVAQVVMNRVNNKHYPDTVCALVKQKKNNICQFSWYCDGKSDVPQNAKAFLIAQIIAYNVLGGHYIGLVENATHYHATYVRPDWAETKTKVVQIGEHIFYRWE